MSKTGVLSGDLNEMISAHHRTIHVGIDRVELGEFERVLATGGNEFVEAVYTDSEREHCGGRLDRLATRFAAKEAASKALGTGFRGISPREIEVVCEASGQPQLRLHGRAGVRAAALGISSMSVSVTHTTTMAEAFVAALTASATTGTPARKEKTR